MGFPRGVLLALMILMCVTPRAASAQPACPEQALLRAACINVLDLRTDVRVRTSLLKANGTAPMLVRVHVEEGVVTLSGAVSSESERTWLEQRTRSVPGVLDVKNALVVMEPTVDASAP